MLHLAVRWFAVVTKALGRRRRKREGVSHFPQLPLFIMRSRWHFRRMMMTKALPLTILGGQQGEKGKP